MIFKSLFLSAIFVFVSVSILGQDPLFNQNDNSAIFNNPAFTGTNESSSIDLTYRNQWPELSANFRTLSLSANQYLGKGNGVSLLYINDNAARTLITNRVSLGYAKQFTVSTKHHFSIGIQTAYFQKALNTDGLTFGDQIDPRTGIVSPSSDPLSSGSVNGLDFHTGILYHNDFIFGGIGVHHIFEPNEGFISSVKLPRRYSFQLGGKFQFKEFVFIPFIQGKSQATFNHIIGSLKTRWKHIELDVGYAYNNGIIGGLGVRFDVWNFGYNYGSSNSFSRTFSVSTHEVRIGFRPNIFKKTNDAYFDFY